MRKDVKPFFFFIFNVDDFPVFNETVQFLAAISPLSDAGIPGTFNPVSDTTNSSGIVVTTYTPSTTVTPILVDITGKVL